MLEITECIFSFFYMTIHTFRFPDGLIYWSDHDIPTNPVKLENQRPFTKPRVYHESDSLAVEATAWALLVMLSKDGVTDAAEKIVQWLNCIRMTNSGFISTVVGIYTSLYVICFSLSCGFLGYDIAEYETNFFTQVNYTWTEIATKLVVLTFTIHQF